jgi:hypothetical protein
MRGFFSGLFMAVGGMIAVLSGLCNVFYIFMMLMDAFTTKHSWHDILGGLTLLATVGGIPFAVGLTLFWIGKQMRKS